MTVRVVIVDDQPIIRSALRALIEADPGFTVVAEAGDGATGIEAVRANRPDVVLMDIRMPGVDGLEATRQLTDRYDDVAVVILTTFDLDAYVFAAIRAGATGFLLKDGDADDLRAAIRAAASGDALMSPRSLRRLIDEFAATPTPSSVAQAAVASLTPREREVLILVARGLNNAEIADALTIGEATAKTHVGNLLAKLHCRDRAQLVITAFEAGAVTPGGASPGRPRSP